jgi:hypothetical protein
LRTVGRLLAVAVMGVVVSVIGVASPAHASGGACGSTCFNKNPMNIGCASDARTVNSFTFASGAVLQIRASNSCNGAWLRITGAAQGTSLVISNNKGQTIHDSVSVGGVTNFTNMVDFDPGLTSPCGILITNTVVQVTAGGLPSPPLKASSINQHTNIC